MKLLENLYSIHSMSGQENAMRNFIKKYVRDHIDGAACRQENGNLYIVKGESDTYPCVVAHLDQVQTKHSSDFKVFLHDNVLFGYSAKSGRQEGLGADDKNGIWVALKCLERFDAIKVALFKEEEVGCCGSRVADMGFFSDCRFVIQADRRNGGDLITDICGPICSDEFIADIMPFAKARGYNEAYGMMTDVETLSDKGVGLSCINMSCGYYKPHTDEGFTRYDELLNCLALVEEIIVNCTKVYPFERRKTFASYGGRGRYTGPFFDWYGINSQKRVANEAADADMDEGEDEEYLSENDLYIPDFKDYREAVDAVYDFVNENVCIGFDPYTIYDYIAADCDAYGIDFEDYCAIVDDVYDCVQYNDSF